MLASPSCSSNSQASKNKICIFCDIVAGRSPLFKVWESNSHLAFLSIYPNTKGATVVIPKKHFDSYAFDMPPNELSALTLAAQEVAHLLDKKLPGVGRTALVYEGFGVNHVHAKLFPMHGTDKYNKEWQPIKSSIKKYFEIYEGYISSHDSSRADDNQLKELAEYLRSKE